MSEKKRGRLRAFDIHKPIPIIFPEDATDIPVRILVVCELQPKSFSSKKLTVGFAVPRRMRQKFSQSHPDQSRREIFPSPE
jgi:hypothetical protein